MQDKELNTGDFEGYIVASFDASAVTVIANFRHEADARKFVTMQRLAKATPNIGIVFCESKAPIWTVLERALPAHPATPKKA